MEDDDLDNARVAKVRALVDTHIRLSNVKLYFGFLQVDMLWFASCM